MHVDDGYEVWDVWGASGADIAQKILSCDDPSNLGPISLSGLKADGLSAVARAAATSEVTDEAFLNELVDKATRGLPQLSPADVCNIIESFSELGAIQSSSRMLYRILSWPTWSLSLVICWGTR
eukprot:jgi/Picre1/30612/NNA_005973.t1